MAKLGRGNKNGLSGEPRPATRVVHGGREPEGYHGFVNTPVYRGSTVLFPTLEQLRSRCQDFTYGRRGTPTTKALEEALTELEGGSTTVLTASGYQAVNTVLLAFLSAGDHVLVTDSVYQPTRRFCDLVLRRLGIQTTYYDPSIGAGIERLLGPETRLIFTESPGSQTFEIQDIPAIASVARSHDVWLVMDNTWATPLYFKPLAHGVDVSIQAATKYIAGHADAMLGAITASGEAAPEIERARDLLGVCPGSEETFLGLRGLRTLDVRLARHQESGLEMARWLARRPEVARVLHPALESHAGHDIWRRDFRGSTGLFSIVLEPVSDTALAAMLDGLELFGMGFSWGGYESLILPFEPNSYRTAVPWTAAGPALRLHIGLEDARDLKADLEAGFDRLGRAA